MESYSQSKEDLIIRDYFKGEKGTLLSVGENDGVTFSNAKLLIELGWKAHLIEPSSVGWDLMELHNGNKNVNVFILGLGDREEVVNFYESANHVINGTDRALVSSVNYEDTLRWRKSGVQFKETKIHLDTFTNFHKSVGSPKYDFITIDCESYDWIVLQQINLKEVGCKALIIEWNGDKKLRSKIANYCMKHGLKLSHKNAENLIFFR